MNIGQAAQATGVSAKMIRYYEETNLIRPAQRSAAGYRVYGTDDIQTLRFVRRARDLGFTVRQIEALLLLWRDHSRASADVKRIATDHIVALQKKMRELQEMVGTLHAAGRTENPREVEAAVWHREGKGVTGFGHGFAIPHGMTDAVRCQSITFARFCRPIEWGSLDGEPVRVALMLTARETGADQTHLKLLAKLARRLMHEGFRESLMRAPDAGSVLNVLQTELELG